MTAASFFFLEEEEPRDRVIQGLASRTSRRAWGVRSPGGGALLPERLPTEAGAGAWSQWASLERRVVREQGVRGRSRGPVGGVATRREHRGRPGVRRAAPGSTVKEASSDSGAVSSSRGPTWKEGSPGGAWRPGRG